MCFHDARDDDGGLVTLDRDLGRLFAELDWTRR